MRPDYQPEMKSRPINMRLVSFYDTVVLEFSDIVALNDAGQLEALLPPITAGTCGWCRGSGLVRDLGGFLCQTCISMAFELIRATVANDADGYAVLEKKIDSRKRITRETVH